MKEIDARKLACPTPVLLAKAAIEEESPAAIKVVVDNEASQQNVSRFLNSRSYATEVDMVGNDYHVTGRQEAGAGKTEKPESSPAPSAQSRPSAARKILVMVSTDRIGYGDDSLGLRLMVNFINTLNEMAPDLWRVIMVNNGVKLAVSGSEGLSALQNLERDGIKIMVCGTCLDHYKLLDKKQVGETTNMLDIVTAMQVADKVINI